MRPRHASFGTRTAATRAPEGDGEWRVPFADFAKATQVRLSPRDGAGGQARLHRVEEGKEVLAQGLTRAVRGAGDVTALVPPGEYRVERVSGRGTWRHPATHTMPPGGQMRIPIE